jgi:hypothetical protein
VKIIDENPAGNRVALGRHLGERINIVVVLLRDVMQLDSSKFVLQLAHLLAVHVHEGALAVGLLHDLVHHQLGVAIGIEPGCSELNGDAEAKDKALIFGDVV